MRRGATLVAAWALAVPASAQTLEEIRDDLRESLRQAKYAASLAGLVLLAEELDLSGASYDIDAGGPTEVSAFVLPFSTVLRPFERRELGLYVEGVAGITRTTEENEDVFGGALPGLEASVDAEWRSYGALAGAGPSWTFGEELTAATIFAVGVARLENDADYGGPGAALGAAIFDSVALNWHSWALTRGAALRVDWRRDFDERRSLSVVGRFDARWTDTLEADDPALEFSTRTQLATLRAEYAAPTGKTVLDRPLDFRVHAGARRLTEGDLFGVREIYEAGGALVLLEDGLVPFSSGVKLSGSAFFGESLRGWSVGLGLTF